MAVTRTYKYTTSERISSSDYVFDYSYSAGVFSVTENPSSGTVGNMTGTVTGVSFSVPFILKSTSKNVSISYYFKIKGANGINYTTSTISDVLPDNDATYTYSASLTSSNLPPPAAFNGTFLVTVYASIGSYKNVYVPKQGTISMTVTYNKIQAYGYSGGSWQAGTLKAYNGSSWVTPKVYTGSEWKSL